MERGPRSVRCFRDACAAEVTPHVRGLGSLEGRLTRHREYSLLRDGLAGRVYWMLIASWARSFYGHARRLGARCAEYSQTRRDAL